MFGLFSLLHKPDTTADRIASAKRHQGMVHNLPDLDTKEHQQIGAEKVINILGWKEDYTLEGIGSGTRP